MKKVVVIGGGFTGAYCAKKLEKEFDVTLIDAKDYFEFTPGILRTIVEPEHAGKIEVLHKNYLEKTRIIKGNVKHVGKNNIDLEDGSNIIFDYIIIATGSRYNSPIKESNIILADRGRMLKENYEKLCKAKNVLIIGGGIVGVELAAEISEKYKDKEIIIVHSKNRFMERQPEKASKHAGEFLKKNNVKIYLNETVKKFGKKIFETDKGMKIEADMTFICTGIIPNYEMLEKCFKDSLDQKNFAKVNKHLQLSGHGNIFAGGDIAGVNEEKTAQNAEKQARIIVRNIKNIEMRKKLAEYKSLPRIMIISLGKHDGIISYKNFALTGMIPGMLKSFVEWKTMMRYRS